MPRYVRPDVVLIREFFVAGCALVTLLDDPPIGGSLIAEGDHGVDLHRAPRRDVAGQCSDSKERKRNQRQSDRIVGGHFKKQVGDEARRSDSSRYANCNAGQCEHQRLPQDHAQD